MPKTQKMMEDYDRTMELVEVAQDSAGRSEEQFSKYSDTLTYKINRLKNSWEQLRISFLNSDTYKWGVDFANRFMEALGKMDLKQFAGIAVIGVTIGRQLIINIFNQMKTASQEWVSLGGTFADGFVEGFRKRTGNLAKKWGSAAPVATDMTSALKNQGYIDSNQNAQISKELKDAEVAYTQIDKKVAEIGNELRKNTLQIEKENQKILEAKNNYAETILQINERKEKQREIESGLEKEKQLKQELRTLESQQHDANIERHNLKKGSEEYIKLEQEIIKRKENIAEIKKEVQEIKQKNANNVEINNTLTQEIASREMNLTEIDKEIAKSEEVIAKNNQDREALKKKLHNHIAITNELSKQGKLLKQGIGSAISTGVTVTATMLLSGQDLGTALKTAVPMIITSIIPTILQMLASALAGPIAAIGSALAGPVGLFIAAATAVGLALYNLEKVSNTVIEAERKRAKQSQETLNNLQKEFRQSQKNAKEAEKNQKKMQDDIAEYEKLRDKAFRTQKEQERYEELYNTISNDYSEVVDSLDENTKVIKINNSAVNQLTEEYQKTINENRQRSLEIVVEAKDTYESAKETRSNVVSAAVSSASVNSVEDFYDLIKTVFSDEELGKVSEKISAEDFGSVDGFVDALEKADITVQDFADDLMKKSESLDMDLENEYKNFAKEYYKTLTVNGQEISDKMADFLSENLDIQIDNVKTQWRDYDGDFFADDDKVFIRNFKRGKAIIDPESQKLLNEYFKDNEIDPEKLFNNTNLQKWEELPDELREFADNMGYTATTWSTLANNAASTASFLRAFSERAIKTKKLEKEASLNEEYLKDYEKNILALQDSWDNLGNYTKQDLEKIKIDLPDELVTQQKIDEEQELVEELSYSEDLKQAQMKVVEQLKEDKARQDAIRAFNEEVEEQQKKIDDVNKNFADKIGNINISDLNLKEKILKLLQDTNLTSTFQDEYGKILGENFKGLNEEQVDTLSSIDFSNDYQTLLESKDEYIKRLQETGESLSDATKIVDKYIEDGVIYLGKNNFGVGTAELFLENLDEYAINFQETFDSVKSAQEQLSEGKKLTTKQIKALKKAGYTDIVETYNSKGKDEALKLMESALVTGAMRPLEQLDSEIAMRQKQLKTAETFTKQTQWNLSSANWVKNFSKLTELQNKYGFNRTGLSDKDLIKIYHESSDDFEEIAKSLGLTKNEMLALQTAAKDGKASIKEYVDGLRDYISTLDKSRPETWITGLNLIDETLTVNQEKIDDLKKELEDLDKELEKNKEDVDKAKEGIDKAQESMDKAQQSLADANQQMEEAIHGTDKFASSLDGLVNYANRLKTLEDAISDIKDALEEVSSTDEATGLFNALNKNYDKRAATLTAQNRAIDDAINNIKNTLLSNYGSYISFDDLGNALVDFNYINMDANDEIRKAFEQEFNLYQEYIDKRRENDKSLRDLDKERKEYRKQVLDDYVSLQDKVIDTLKDQAKEEVDITKEKYDAMADADSEYLDALEDAINKQKELREKEKSWNDLATQEKKLSLMQRDTSGANAKEVANLEKSIQDSREKLLDDSVNDIIKNLKELYDKQKEARELEIEYMEDVTENAKYFADWAQSIMSGWTSSEDLMSWFMENNPDVEDMTVEQKEQYMSELQTDFSNFSKWGALLINDMQEDANAIAEEVDFLYNNISDNIWNIGTVTQEVAQAAADESVASAQTAIDSAYDAIAAAKEEMEQAQQTYDDAVTKMNDTQAKITETKDALQKAEEDSLSQHTAAVKEMVDATNSGILEVSTHAAKILLEWSGKDINDASEIIAWAQQNNIGLADENGNVSESLYRALQQSGADMTQYTAREYTTYEVWHSPGGGAPARLLYTSSNEEKANEFRDSLHFSSGEVSVHEKINKYKQGGLVDYTGPAWVDGTKKHPEAFLDAEDTSRFMNAADLLSQIPILNSGSYSTVSSNTGDTNVQIYLTVENIADDYSVDQMMERMREDILDASSPVGSAVILSK